MIKLIGIDLDDTLLNSKKELSEGNKEAINKVIKKGITVSIFTGRNYPSAIKYVKELGLDVPCVFQNGALIMKPLSKEVINKIALSKLDAITACEYLKENKKEFAIYTDFFEVPDIILTKKCYESNFKRYFENNRWRSRVVDDVLKELKKLQKNEIVEIAFLSERSFVDSTRMKFKDLSVISSTEINNEYFSEIFGKGIGKEMALSYLEKHYNVSAQETMFIGDGYNDLEIIKKVKYGVAMENANEEVKSAAAYTTSSNNADGVKKILEKLILKN